MSKSNSVLMVVMGLTMAFADVAQAGLPNPGPAGVPGGIPRGRPPVRLCTMPGQVTYCGTVGTSKAYDFDALSLLEAVAANNADFQALKDKGRRIFTVKVEILPSKDAAIYSNITQYTITAGQRGGFMPRPRDPSQDVKLVLKAYFDKRIQDDTPTIWESSGVIADLPTPVNRAAE